MKNTTLIGVVLLVLVLFAPAIYFVDRQTMFEIVDGLAAGACFGVLVKYAKPTWYALKLPVHLLRSGDYLIVGVTTFCIGAAARLTGQWYWRAHGKPEWFIDNPALVYFTLLMVIGMFMMVTTTFTERGNLVIGALRRTMLIVGFSLSITVFLVWLSWGP